MHLASLVADARFSQHSHSIRTPSLRGGKADEAISIALCAHNWAPIAAPAPHEG
jgi:hypothetical protein